MASPQLLNNLKVGVIKPLSKLLLSSMHLTDCILKKTTQFPRRENPQQQEETQQQLVRCHCKHPSDGKPGACRAHAWLQQTLLKQTALIQVGVESLSITNAFGYRSV